MYRKVAFGAHRVLSRLCIQSAGLHRDLKLANPCWLRLLEMSSIAWGLIIALTHSIKLFMVIRYGARNQKLNTTTRLLLLDFLPRNNDFYTLYATLVLTVVGAGIILRLQMMFSGGYKGRKTFDPVIEAVNFFIEGPPSWEEKSDVGDRGANQLHRNQRALVAEAMRPTWAALRRERARRIRMQRSKLETLDERDEVPTVGEYQDPYLQLDGPFPDNQRLIGYVDILRDKSARRWKFLARWVYSTAFILIVVVSLPLTYYMLVTLALVNQKFGPDMSAIQHQDSKLADIFLVYYGYSEQAFILSQCFAYFVPTNIFIMLAHADILYKARPICSEISLLTKLFLDNRINTMPLATVQRQKLRIWSYFHEIDCLDTILTTYTAISQIAVAAALILGQSFTLIQDKTLKVGSLAGLASILFSYIYVHFVSESIKRRSSTMRKNIYSIHARERGAEQRREWHQVLNRFFSRNSKLTLTMFGSYQMNLRNLALTLTSLLGSCRLAHRQFHWNQWDRAFE